MTPVPPNEQGAERRLAVVGTVSRFLAQSGGLLESAPDILAVLCHELGWEVGALWEVDRRANRLHCVGTWCSPDVECHKLGQLDKDHTIELGKGLPGRVWEAGIALWGQGADAEHPWTRTAEEAGLCQSVAFPIWIGEELFGVVELFRRRHEEEDAGLIELLGGISGALAQRLSRREVERELYEAGAKYRALVEQIPAIVYIDNVDEDMSTSYVSPQIEELLGIAPQEYIDDPDLWYKHLHPEDKERALEQYLRGRDSGQPFTFEYRLVGRGGRVVWFRDSAVVLNDEHGRPRLVQGVMLDVTEAKEAEGHFRETENRYQTLVEQMPAIVYLDPLDQTTESLYVSPRIKDILGFTQEEWKTDLEFWRKHLHPEDRERAWEEYERGVAKGEPFTYEYRMFNSDEEVVWIREQAVALRDDQGRPLMIQGVMFDVTELKRAEEQVAFLAYHDKLTGLPNRVMFEELLELSIARARRHDASVAAIYLDLDNFKLVNDSLGHDSGDELLRQLADRLREATRETDLVARQGGDEFLLLLADVERGAKADMPGETENVILVAESVVTRIHEALAQPFHLAGTEFYVSASIGISVFPNDASDAKMLLANADAAMYQSKKAGPGGYIVYSSESVDPLSKLSLTTRLRKAVERQNWVLHYQPLVNLDDGAMFGVEALLRWQDPNGGLIPPGEFIPLAEEIGLIEVIGDWVVEELARQDPIWRSQGLELELSFNLSPRQLWQADVVHKIITRLDAANVDPTNVVIEITESTAMTDPERTQRILWDLHARGLRIAIDDFGTGYSSLSRLKHLPVDILKVDRTFVRDIPDDPEASSMVKAIIQLAHGLGMTPLAEGVETAEQWDFLRENDCPLGQGYYFSRPVPSHDIVSHHRRAAFRVVGGGTGA